MNNRNGGRLIPAIPVLCTLQKCNGSDSHCQIIPSPRAGTPAAIVPIPHPDNANLAAAPIFSSPERHNPLILLRLLLHCKGRTCSGCLQLFGRKAD